MASDKWTTVRIPNELHEKIKAEIEKENWGYRTIAQFVNEAVRKRLEDMSKLDPPTPERDEGE